MKIIPTTQWLWDGKRVGTTLVDFIDGAVTALQNGDQSDRKALQALAAFVVHGKDYPQEAFASLVQSRLVKWDGLNLFVPAQVHNVIRNMAIEDKQTGVFTFRDPVRARRATNTPEELKILARSLKRANPVRKHPLGFTAHP